MNLNHLRIVFNLKKTDKEKLKEEIKNILKK